MTTTVTTKAQPKWKLFVRRLVFGRRPTPFWQKRLLDQVEPSTPVAHDAWNPGDNMFNAIMVLAVGALVIAALGMLVIGPLFLSPDFFTIGIADPLGRWYGAVCLSTGNCELPYLFGGTVVAVQVLLLGLMVLHAALRGVFNPDVIEAPDYGAEMVQALGVIDERIVRMRADLVLAGVLKLSPEELADDEEAAEED